MSKIRSKALRYISFYLIITLFLTIINVSAAIFTNDQIDFIEIAKGKQATASSEWPGGSYSPNNANDGNIGTLWSAATEGKQWWQVDLEIPTTISRIEINPRQGQPDTATEQYRKNFRILGSNDKAFPTAQTTVLAEQGDTSLPSNSVWEFDISDKGEYRFLRVENTANQYFVLAEFRAYTAVPKVEYCVVNEHEQMLEITFNTNINAFDLNPQNIQIFDKEAPIEYTNYYVEKSKYHISLEGLRFDHMYTVLIRKGIKNTIGIPTESDFTFEFTTPSELRVKKFSFFSVEGDGHKEIEKILPNKKYGAQLTIKNLNPNDSCRTILMIALYDKQDCLLDINGVYTITEPDSESDIFAYINTTNTLDTDGCKLKVYSWKIIQGIQIILENLEFIN